MIDVDNKRYYDFLSANSAMNHGHQHPEILKIARQQLNKLTLTSRAFHNDLLGDTCEFLSKTLKYDKVLMMNTGRHFHLIKLKLQAPKQYNLL